MVRKEVSVSDQAKIQHMTWESLAPFNIVTNAVITGRQMFNTLSITGLNRTPETILSAFITTDFKAEIKNKEHADPVNPENPVISVDEMTEYLLVDGSFVIQELPEPNADGDKWIFMKDVVNTPKVPIQLNMFWSKVRKDDGDIKSDTMRLFRRENFDSEWIVEDITNPDASNSRVVKTIKFPSKAFYPWANKLHPFGILFPNQNTWKRLEEVEEQIRSQTGPASLSLIVTGYVGDIDQAKQQMSSGARIVFVPGSAQITRVASNNVADQLMSDSDRLMALYFKNTNVANVEGSENISGVSRRLLMTPMLSEVNKQRAMIKEIYSFFDIGASFGGVQLMGADEKIKELDALARALADKVITEEEFTQRARPLFV
jgi:hypothetical protein